MLDHAAVCALEGVVNMNNPAKAITKEIVQVDTCCGSSSCVSENTSSVSDNTQPEIKSASSRLTFANRWDHLMARFGVKRSQHLIEPGLYSLGNPTKDSPVFVSANYTLSFDALRSALAGNDGYILLLDTKGINVWCAAGKGTFGTDELVRRIEAVKLHEKVNHRSLIVPQLGATGVSAREVRSRSGFKVEFGPVRATDLTEYLKTHRATEEMRRVHFGLLDRMVLIPVEFIPIRYLSRAKSWERLQSRLSYQAWFYFQYCYPGFQRQISAPKDSYWAG
jgi:hypothetical protein